MEYWQKRNLEAQEAIGKKAVKETEEQLAKYYSRTLLNSIGSFEGTYNKLLRAVEDGKQPTPADLYKLTSYWEMQAQLRTELEKLGEKQITLFSKQFEKEFIEVYNTISIPTSSVYSTISKEAANQMINQIWVADGKSWSQRIWDNTGLLQQSLNDGLVDIVVTGKKPTELKTMLQENFNASYSRANTIVRTETAHIQTQAAQKRYKDYGIEQVEVWASYDERRCDICGKLHEKKFSINDIMPLPAHPNCRCTIIPVVK